MTLTLQVRGMVTEPCGCCQHLPELSGKNRIKYTRKHTISEGLLRQCLFCGSTWYICEEMTL